MRKWGVRTALDRTAPMGWRARSKGCGAMQGGEMPAYKTLVKKRVNGVGLYPAKGPQGMKPSRR